MLLEQNRFQTLIPLLTTFLTFFHISVTQFISRIILKQLLKHAAYSKPEENTFPDKTVLYLPKLCCCCKRFMLSD